MVARDLNHRNVLDRLADGRLCGGLARESGHVRRYATPTKKP